MLRCQYVALVFLLLTLNILHFFSSFSIVDFEQENVNWETNRELTNLNVTSLCLTHFSLMLYFI